MRVGNLLCLSTGLLLTVAGSSRARDEEPPDYASKPLSHWIDSFKARGDPDLRWDARWALGPRGPYAKVAVPALIDVLAHKVPPAREAVDALADYGPAVVPDLVRALKRPEASVRVGVAQALGRMTTRARKAVPALVEAMKDSVPEVRAAAAWTLGVLGRPADQIIPSLASALRDNHDEVRASAAAALKEMGRKSKPAVPELILALKDKNEQVRESAATALWSIGPDARAAVPTLIECLEKKKDSSRWRFAGALGKIGPEAKEAVPALMAAFQEKDDDLRLWVAGALGDIGPGARAAVPALIAAVKDKDRLVYATAMVALGKIGPDARAAVPVLMAALAGSYPDKAAKALDGIGPAARAAVPALADIARNRFADSWTRQAAAQAVMRIDPEFAAKQGMELAHLDIRLEKVPAVKLAPRAAVTEERKQRIKRLIAQLARVKDPDYGMSDTLTGRAFAPLPDQKQFQGGLVTDHRLKPSGALRSLVEIGPDALPFLLEALGDRTPTKLEVHPLFFGAELKGNPLNPLERRVLSEETADEDDEETDFFDHPTLKVGDVCFVAVGQIVGRPYRAVHYQPTAIVIMNSPVESRELRQRVRAIWSSNDPARKLLDSLLLDYATEGIFNGKTLDGWDEGSDLQVQAAMRLLYYFPEETAPLIAARLRSFDVREVADPEWMKREVKNGVRTTHFIKAVSWCTATPIKEALADIARRTDDPEIKAAAERRGKKRS